MSHLYEDFDEDDDLEEENDEDIGALGSILSWDEEDEEGGAVSRALASLNNSLKDRESGGASTASAPPPETVLFSTNKDGLPQFSFTNRTQTTNGGSLYANSTSAGPVSSTTVADNSSNTTIALAAISPSNAVVPLASDQNANQQRQNANIAQLQQQQSTQQQVTQQLMSSIQAQQGLTPEFAQLIAQHSNLLRQHAQQQQQQQQNTVSSQDPSGMQSQQRVQQANATPIQPAIANFTQGQQTQQHTGAQQQANSIQQTQPTPQIQLQFTSDPSTFLQQLQLAQLQQQLQAAQAQQRQQQHAVQSATTVQIQPSIQQPQVQMQAPYSQQSNVLPIAPTSIAVKPPVNPPSGPPTKKAKTANRKASTQFNGRKTSGFDTKPDLGAAGVVSASDTDGETSRRNKQSYKKPMPTDDEAFDLETADMDPEDKARANRDRNREHARNTRLRKKAYLEKLKVTVDDLCRERDTLVSERTGAAKVLVEMHNTRTEVLMSFFALRSCNEKRRKIWSTILEESCFSCVMPVTPYRSFPASEVQVSKCQRTILGIDGVMADTASLHVLLDSLVDRSLFPRGRIEFRYTLVTEDAVVAGNQMMARWIMSTTNAMSNGLRMEISKQGMLCCKFNSAHKIIGLEVMFDVMAFMLQIKQASGTDGFSVIPNTVQTCQRSFDKPMLMTLADEPFTIIQVNKLWEDMTGFSAEEVVGRASWSILQRPGTDMKAVEEMMLEIRYKRPVSTMLTHFRKSGELFRHFAMFVPLSTDSRITHYLALTQHCDNVVAVDERPPQQQSIPLSVQNGSYVQPTQTSSQTTYQSDEGVPSMIHRLPSLLGSSDNCIKGPMFVSPLTIQLNESSTSQSTGCMPPPLPLVASSLLTGEHNENVNS